MKRIILGTLMFLNIISSLSQVSKQISVSTAGTLSLFFDNSEKNEVTNLIVEGVINARDFKFIRDSLPQLSVIDLGKSTISAYTGTDGTQDMGEITSVYLEDEIPSYAFKDKASLKSIILPRFVKTIQFKSFLNCTELVNFIIPESVIEIKNNAFENCSGLESLIIPYSVKKIGDRFLSGCVNLKSLYVGICYPLTIATNTFYGFNQSGCVLTVPDGSSDSYRAAKYWTLFTTIVDTHSPHIPKGSGTPTDPYQIATIQNLKWLSENFNYWAKDYIQVADIDASSTVNWNNGLGFSPIGNTKRIFYGSYNGKGNKIKGLYINRAKTDSVGFFGCATGNNIDSLTIDSAYIIGSNTVGGIAGTFTSTNKVNSMKNCVVNGEISGKKNVGGLVGLLYGSNVNAYPSIKDCFTSGIVNGTENTGGLIGLSFDTKAQINQCHSVATIIGSQFSVCIGGLIGLLWKGSVTNCYYKGNISGTTNVGGLVGYNFNNANIANCFTVVNVSGTEQIGGLVGSNAYSTINACLSIGTVSGQSQVGGLLGLNQATGKISNCYTTCNVSGDYYSGGFVGVNTDAYTYIHYCYCTNTVSGNITIGSFAGKNINKAEVDLSFWNKNISSKLGCGENNSYFSAIEKTSLELKNTSTFLNATWDMTGETQNGQKDYWEINPEINSGYPYLVWQKEGNFLSHNNITKEGNYKIFYNSQTKQIIISDLDLHIISIEIYDMNGKLCEKVDNNTRTIKHTNLHGAYLLIINTRSNSFVKKIIIT